LGSPTGADAIDVSTDSTAAMPAVNSDAAHGTVRSPTPVALKIARRLCAKVLTARSVAHCQNWYVNIAAPLWKRGVV
jgi:hypothetical protein